MECVTTQGTTKDEATYRLVRAELTNTDPKLLADWADFLRQYPSGTPLHDPAWLRQAFGGQDGTLCVYFLYQGSTLRGFAPCFLKNWPFKWQLGEITVARMPLRRLRLLGGGPNFPPETAPYELLFAELMTQERQVDAVYVDDLAVGSVLWDFLESSPKVAATFSRYLPEPPSPRVMLRLEGSFEDYMGRFSSKHRQTLKRKVRKFEDTAPGEVRTVRFTRPEEVESFIEQAASVSQKTYQWKLLGEGLRPTDKVKRYYSFLAEHEWFRSYLLISRTTPVAFISGYQYGSRFYLDDMGYDPDYREYSVGTVLQLGIIEDLFGYNRPEVYDLGEFGTHKEEFATEQHNQGKVLLFKRGLYTNLVRAGHRGCNTSTTAASQVLERLGLKKRLKKLIRTWSSRS